MEAIMLMRPTPENACAAIEQRVVAVQLVPTPVLQPETCRATIAHTSTNTGRSRERCAVHQAAYRR